MKRFLTFGLFISLVACGNSSNTNEDNPPTNYIPNIKGLYSCVGGCQGDYCYFSNQLMVTQTDDNFIASDPDPNNTTSDIAGTITEEGDVSATLDNGECDGQFVQDKAVMYCILDGVTCQSVTYAKQ